MKNRISINQPHIRAKIIGITLITIGVIFLINPTPLNIKISFASIVIGIFVIFMITEKSIPKKISDAQAEENLGTINKIIKDLNLNGNAIFLPKSNILNEERILIPPNNTGILKIPDADNNTVFLTGKDGTKFGITIPPAGLKLLKEISKDGYFENTKIENIEEKLQIFVGMNLLKSVSFRPLKSGWCLEIEKPMFCNNGNDRHNQYPCTTCSAIITAITRSLNEKLRIYNVTKNGEKIVYHLNLIKRREQQGE